MKEQVIFLDGYTPQDPDFADPNRSFSQVLKKKASSIFTRTNVFHGECERCSHEICMKCGLPYHRQKDCRKELDRSMKEFFSGLENKQTMTNCPKCGMIVQKEEGGCNHMICSKCKYQFCWICGMKYDVSHFDPNNVFGCQGLQESQPHSRCKLISVTLVHTLLIPFTLLLYPMWVMLQSFINPFNMPKKYRWICFCKHLSLIVDNCCFSLLLLIIFLPIVIVVGLVVGVLNMVIFTVPAVLWKLYKLLVMTLFWRCSLNRHKY